MRFGLVALLALCVVSPSLGAPPKFSRGEKVQVREGFETYTGEVVRVLGNGWVMVKYANRTGMAMTVPFSPDSVQRIRKSPKTTKSGPGSSRKNPLRSWSDTTGKFTVRARFLEISEGNVRLEQEEGTTLVIPLSKLSDTDQKQAQDSARTTTPFKSEEKAAPADDAAEEPSEVPRGDWSDVKTVSPTEVGAWTLKADSAASPSLAPKSIAFHGSKNRQPRFNTMRAEAIFLNRQHSEAQVFVADMFQGRHAQDPSFVVHRVDLVRGKGLPPTLLKTGGTLLDVDPTGRRVALSSDFRFGLGKSPQVQVWELSSPKAKLVSAWNPSEETPRSRLDRAPVIPNLERGIEVARFVDADHLLTTNAFSKLVLWEVSTRRAIYTTHLSGYTSFALSSNCKYLAIVVESGIAVLDPATGNTLGQIRTEPPRFATLAFQPDGKRLAAVTREHVVVWDFEKGEEYRDIFFPTPIVPSRLDWVADGYLLIGGTKLIDLNRRVVLWEYSLPYMGWHLEQRCGELGGVLWYPASDNFGAGIVGVALPNAEAKLKAATLNADELLVLKPGGKVCLTVEIQDSPREQKKETAAGAVEQKKTAEDVAAERKQAEDRRQLEQQRITGALTAQLLQLGIKIDPSSRLILAAAIMSGKMKEQSFRVGPFGQDVEKANLTERTSRLRLLEGSNVLWEASGKSSAPVMVQQRPGQSLQAAIDQYQDPMIFFGTVQLPQNLARPGEGGAYGASLLTAAGIKDMSVAELRNLEAEARKLASGAQSGALNPAAAQPVPVQPGAIRRAPAGGGIGPGGANRPGAPTGGL